MNARIVRREIPADIKAANRRRALALLEGKPVADRVVIHPALTRTN